jgi:hypothetical protein
MDDEKYLIILKDVLIKHSIEGLFGCFNKDIYNDFPIVNIEGERFERYKYLYSFILRHVQLSLKVAEDTEYKPKLLVLKGFIDKLDSYGLDVHLTPEMSEKEQRESIRKLDEEKVLFSKTLSDAVNVLKQDKETLRFILAFGRLCYRFNEYQAPFRLSAEEATRDAMGLSDHYQELINHLMQ